MKKLQISILLLCLNLCFISFSQENNNFKKIKISGKIIDKLTLKPLEYATIRLQNTNKPAAVSGGITAADGTFEFEVVAGIYDLKIEFISFDKFEIKQKNISENWNIGTISLLENATMLNEVTVRTEKTTVEIKLDKKIYNVGKDILVKGGTVSDVLDNIPSVSVDTEGVVSLRGNENVMVLIDGKPTNALNIAQALRQIPADAVEKVEVVTNPSARYDAEGGGGLLNIILKKGKNQGWNGSLIISGGYPTTYGVSATVNFKTEKTNFFTNTSYNKRDNRGNALFDSQYLNLDGSPKNYIVERRNNLRSTDGYSTVSGVDWFLNQKTTLTTLVNFRKNNGDNPENIVFENFDNNHNFLSTNLRENNQNTVSEDLEWSANFVQTFDKEDKKWTIDAAIANNHDTDTASIIDDISQKTLNAKHEKRSLIKTDLILPFGKNYQFETGYKGEFKNQIVNVDFTNIINGNIDIPTSNNANTLDYTENINAVYAQLGNKIDPFSYLIGLRYEQTDLGIGLAANNENTIKKFKKIFPSAFLTYKISEKSSLSASVSQRISRPRIFHINPMRNFSSNINIFQGNPNINPSFTDVIDFGYLHRWNKITFNTSLYFNKTTDSFQVVRRESGEFYYKIIEGADIYDNNGNLITIVGQPDIKTPIIIATPINLATELRLGFEFTLNYTPFKWWKLNSNFNFFQNETQGKYVYTNFQNNEITQNFDKTAFSWSSRLNSKITFPNKIDFQTNLTYNAPQVNAQGKNIGVLAANIGFSKDILKDKATIALNVQDLFNSRKRISETNLPQVNTYSEMQRAERQILLSFTYRFNKKKGEKEKQPRKEGENEGGEF